MNVVKWSEIKFMVQRPDFPPDIFTCRQLLAFFTLLYAGIDLKLDIFMSNFQLTVQKFLKTILCRNVP